MSRQIAERMIFFMIITSFFLFVPAVSIYVHDAGYGGAAPRPSHQEAICSERATIGFAAIEAVRASRLTSMVLFAMIANTSSAN